MERNEKDIEQLIELSQNEKRVKQKLYSNIETLSKLVAVSDFITA